MPRIDRAAWADAIEEHSLSIRNPWMRHELYAWMVDRIRSGEPVSVGYLDLRRAGVDVPRSTHWDVDEDGMFAPAVLDRDGHRHVHEESAAWFAQEYPGSV